ncbi:MAG TPA: N-acetylmuramic acid 6-phosphate etherase [Candidatus Acidoferrum sp.]|nr:N-acetylmuramic acid 6-phosphate etherase [Candidatus Acidoferrum sp.]
MCSTGKWKCCSNSLLRTSMNLRSVASFCLCGEPNLVLPQLFATGGFASARVALFAEYFLTLAGRSYNSRMPSSNKPRRSTDKRRTEQRNQASKNLDHMSSKEIVVLMSREDQKVPAAVAHEIPAIARAVDAIVSRMKLGGRLIYVGAGTSGRLGVLDASECPPTFGTSPQLVRALIAGGRKAVTEPVEGAEDSKANARRDLRQIRLTKNDSVVGLAASGTTPYVLSAIAYAKRRGALTIAVTANRKSSLAKTALIAIAPDVGPEVLTGSTRLKAGTAQKMVLNMLSTATMVRLGHAYQNLMIDLTKTNRKLRDRAKRILMEATGKSVSEAEQALRQSKHNLRVALIMLKRRITAERARKTLEAAGGDLRRALGE